jgi:hypothetical protein
MRASRLLIAALVGLTLTAPAAAEAATVLYPDLKTLPPRNLRFDRADVSQDSSGVLHNVLRFSNTVVNEGEGAVEIRALINQRLNPPAGPAFQRVYDTDGAPADLSLGASTLYYHAVHVHYHFDHWGEYQLWTKAEYDRWIASGRTVGEPDLVGQKTTSCVMDEEFVRSVPAAVYPDRYPGGACMPNQQNVIAQGLSVGWGDTYDYYRFEQWIDLNQSRLADGTYVLRSVSDPYNLVYESPNKADVARENQLDNEATTTFVVSGGAIVDSDAPTGTVTINHVDRATSSPLVNLDVLGRDDVSGVTEFRVTTDHGANWRTFTNTSRDSNYQRLSWDLSDGATGGSTRAGTRTVCVMFKDRSGKWGPVQTDTIEYEPPPVVVSAYGRAVAADAPVAWWRLGETSGTTALNQISGGPSGTYVGGTTLNQASLVATDPANRAVAFNGSTGRVGVATSSALDLRANFSLETWIKPASLPSSGSFRSVLTKPEAYSLQFNGPRLEFTIMQNGTRRRLQTPTGAIVAGGTYHVVATYDGATQRLYLNGTQVASAALTGNATVNANALAIGAWGSLGEYFAGTIDEPAIYSTVLSAARVRAHHDAAFAVALDAPANLSARARSTTEIDLSWIDHASGETGQVLERSTSSSFATVTPINVAAGAQSYADSGLAPGTTYWYRVKAVDGSSSSPYSNAISVTTPSPATYAQLIDSEHPVSYWRLGETSGTIAGDETVVGPGTFVGSPILGVPSLLHSDPANLALGFNGGTSEVRVGQTSAYDLTNALSLESWIKPTALGDAGRPRTIVAKTGSYALGTDGSRATFTIVQGGVRRTLASPAGTLIAGVTTHLVGTYDGSTQRLYADGVQVASATLPGNADLTIGGVRIGSWDGAGEFFAGTIDDTTIADRAFSAAQVSGHHAAGKAPLGAPGDLAATAASATRIDLQWTDNATAETGFVVQRATDPAFSSPTTINVAANARRHADTTARANTDYWYRVRAVTASQSSAWSAATTARTHEAPAAPAYEAAIAADAPVSWWRLSETAGTTAADQQGVANGTYSANGKTLGVAGLVPSTPANTAVAFNGSNGTVRVGHTSAHNLTSAVSLEAWIRPTTLPSSGNFRSVLTKAEAYSLQFNGPRLEFTIIQNGTRRRLQTPTGTIVAGTTYHVVGTFDGSAQRLYVNGVQVASVALSGAASTSTTGVHIGSWSGGGEYFAGTIDEAAIYRTALPAASVAAHHSAGTGL